MPKRARRRATHRRRRRLTHPALLVILGVSLISIAIIIPALDAFNRAGIFERAFGFSALRAFANRASSAFLTDRRLLWLAIAGLILLILAHRNKR